MDTHKIDEQLREFCERNSPPFDEAAFSDRLRSRTSGSHKQAYAPRRTSGLRIAVVAFAVLVLLAGVGTAIYTAVTYLGNLGENGQTAATGVTLVIGDDTTLSSTPGQTSQTTLGKLPSGFWLRLPLLTEGGPVGSLVMDPDNPSTLYVATSERLFKSIDGAGTWNQLPRITGDVQVLFIDPTSASTIYVVRATASETDEEVPNHLLRSDDGGLTWTDLTEAGAPRMGGDLWLATTFETTTTPSTIYMYDDTGYVWRSTDRGTTWTRLSFDEGQQAFSRADTHGPRPRPAAAQEAVDAFVASFGDADSVHLTDADTGAVVSIDEGAILVDPVSPATFYVASPYGVYKSTDGGRSWRKAITGLGLVDRAVSTVLVDPNTPSTLYATTNAGIFRSTDGGTEWTLILGGGGSVVLAPSTPSRLYASTDAGLFRSDDGGHSWTRLDATGFPTGGRPVLVVADRPDTLFAVAGGGFGPPPRLYRSVDSGNSWEPAIEGVTFYPTVLADPQHPSTIYVSGYIEETGQEHGAFHVLKSTDAGATWTDFAQKDWDALVMQQSVVSAMILSVDPHNPDTLWAIQYSYWPNEPSIIRRSTDGGVSWERVELAGLGPWIMWLVFDPRSADTLYAYAGPTFPEGTVHRSTDGGATWENIGAHIPGSGVWWNPVFLVPDPAPGGALYAATDGGLFMWVPHGE